MRRSVSVIMITLLFFSTCQADKPDKYIPKSPRKREKFATPEPGTYLKPIAFSVLKKINQVIEEPDSYKKPAEWMMEVFTAHQKRLLDTLLRMDGIEVPVRIYYPSKKSLNGNHPVTLFIHGGGFILGSIDEYHMMVSKLAKITGNIMISVEYRLAPDHPFPEGLTDCFTVLKWIQEHGYQIGADTTRICVMGDSAGGNISTVLTLLCRDKRRPQPKCQVLIYPGLTFADTPFPSRVYFGQSSQMNYVLSESFMRKVKAQYLGTETNDKHPYLSPLEANLTKDLAPALIITAECDPIRDDGRYYAEKLGSAGIAVKHIEYTGMFHGFVSFHMILGDALDAMKEIRDYLERI